MQGRVLFTTKDLENEQDDQKYQLPIDILPRNQLFYLTDLKAASPV